MSAAHDIAVSFIVVNFNGSAVLRDCLSSIEAQTFGSSELILIDNGSSDGSCEAAEREFPGIKLVRYGENLGFAEANNRAIALARGEFLALINNDATLEPSWTERMVLALRQHPEAGAAACRTLQSAHAELLDSAGFAFYSCASVSTWKGSAARRFADAQHAPFGATASAALYRRSAVQAVGVPFHPEYFCYYEDTDLAVRLVLYGFSTVYVPDAIARHVGSHTGRDHSDFHLYHLRRNAEYLFWTDMVGYLAWLHLPLHLLYESLALAGALRSGQAQVVLKAKRDAFAQRRWIMATRRELAARLARERGLRRAQAELRRAIRVGMPVFARWHDLRARASRATFAKDTLE